MPAHKPSGRYKNPQAWIDHVLETDLSLRNVILSYPPRYSGRLKMFGQATLEEPGLRGLTTIGRPSLRSRRELVDTIVHEEIHHRLWKRARKGSARAWRKIDDLVLEEAYVERAVRRFWQRQDYFRSTGK